MKHDSKRKKKEETTSVSLLEIVCILMIASVAGYFITEAIGWYFKSK